MSGDEDEDLSRAIQNSLLESIIDGENMAVGTSGTDEAEDIARALEESLKISKLQSSSTSITRDIQRKQLICDTCGTLAGVRVNYWGQKLCLQHSSDMCFSCLRFKMMGMRYINLNDERKMCLLCYSVSILDTHKGNLVFNKVHEFYKESKIEVDRKIPFFLVDQIDMCEVYASGGGTEGFKPSGLTLTMRNSEVIKRVTRSLLRGENIDVIKKTEYVDRGVVSGMLVLYGCSVLQTGKILAHEMMHTWFRLKGYSNLERKVEEGICEVMGINWLNWYNVKADKSFSYTSEQIQFLENLKILINGCVEVNYEEIYGDGFREAKWAVERFGLKYTLDFICKETRLPP